MTTRTEEDKLMQTPITIILGGKEYELKPLPIKYSMLWCRKVTDIVKDLPKYLRVTEDSGDAFSQALSNVMNESPDKIVDLFFEYARNLNKDEISEVASSSEIIAAFERCLELERPFMGSLKTVIEKIAPRETQKQR